MADPHNGKPLSVEEAILYVLAGYWDPLHLQSDASRRRAYARHVAPVREALAASPSTESLADFLREAKVRDFGVAGFPGTRERRAARKLLEIGVHCEHRQTD